jgi:superfamily II helicase
LKRLLAGLANGNKMVKEKKVKKEIIEHHKYCDDCGKEIKYGMACSKASCEYCGKDLCEDCVDYEASTMGDYREVYCTKCNGIRLRYKPKIDELENEIERLENERLQVAKSS